MTSPAADAAAESVGVTCTHLGRQKDTLQIPSAVSTDKLPDTGEMVTPLWLLAEMKAINGSFQALTEQLHVWAEQSALVASSCSKSSTTMAQPHSPNTVVQSGYPAAPKATVASWRIPERCTLYLLHTAIEQTRRLVAKSQSEVWILLRKLVAAGSVSGSTPGQILGGEKYSNGLSDIPNRGSDALAHHHEAERSDNRQTHVVECRPSRFSIPLSLSRREEGYPNIAPTAVTDTMSECLGNLADHPKRRPWPSAHFCYVVHVEFKRRRMRRFVSPVTLRAGTYVIVPGDRGYDCGLVLQCALWNPEKQGYEVTTIQSLDSSVLAPGKHGSIMEVIRVATDDEVYRLHRNHVSMERLALTTCQDIVDHLRLPMEVLDCEYQYDGTKISFFFESNEVIDFRNLNKELFRMFNARIWLQNINRVARI